MDPADLSDRRLEEIVRALYAAELDNLHTSRLFLEDAVRDAEADGDDAFGELEDETARDLNASDENRLRSNLSCGRVGAVQEVIVDGLIDEHALPLTRGATSDMEYKRLAALVGRALLELIQREGELARGQLWAEVRDPLFKDADVAAPAKPTPTQAPATPEPKGRAATPLSEVIKAYRELEGTNYSSSKTLPDYERSVRTLIRVIGDVPIGTVYGEQLAEFADTLQRTPANFAKRFETDDPLAAIEKNAALAEPLPPMNRNTINNKYLSNLRSFFAWAARKHYCASNPAEGLSVTTTKRSKGANKRRRLPFSTDQLQRLFATPVFTGCKSASRLKAPGDVLVDDHRFWVPLIGLLMGLRLNEIGQADHADIVPSPVEGIRQLRVHAEADPEDPDDDARSLKTENAARLVPIPPVLGELGFFDYVACRRHAGAAPRLFPAWQRAADGYYSSLFSKWFNGHYLPAFDLKTPKTCFHSLRHNYKDALRDLGLKAEPANYVMGHGYETVHEEYGSEGLRRHEIERFAELRYEGLDLSRIPRRR